MARYAISDLHGMYEIYRQVKEFIKPEDTVYFLGDAGDRGPDCWKTIKAIALDPQWVYMKGNHEDMLLNALTEYKMYDGMYGEDQSLLAYNGGSPTFDEITSQGKETIDWVINLIKKMPTHIILKNEQGHTLSLSHAGMTPRKDYTPSEHQLIWDRNHLRSRRWPEEEEFTNRIEIHGHTPIPAHFCSERGYKPGAWWYCKNHKVDIDCGAVFLGSAVLLDLDTFDEYIFTDTTTVT